MRHDVERACLMTHAACPLVVTPDCGKRHGLVSGISCRLSGGKPMNPISTDSMPMLRSTNLPAMTSLTRALMISPLPANVAIGFVVLPNVPMYLYGKGSGCGSGGCGGWGLTYACPAVSHAA